MYKDCLLTHVGILVFMEYACILIACIELCQIVQNISYLYNSVRVSHFFTNFKPLERHPRVPHDSCCMASRGLHHRCHRPKSLLK